MYHYNKYIIIIIIVNSIIGDYMDDKDKDLKNKIIKIASNEILKGSKMLGKHCKCGFPLFEDESGNIYCPNCKYVENDFENNNRENGESRDNKKKGYLNMQKILCHKVEYLLNRLDNETEINRILEIGNAIKVLLDIMNRLE